MKSSSPIEPAITGPRSLRNPRSREYAVQTMRSLKRFIESKTFDAQHIAKELQLIEQHKHWEVCGFKTIDAYLKAEAGVAYKELKRRLAQDLAGDPNVPPADDYGGDRKSEDRDQVAISHLNELSSDSAERIVRRLKRDHPKIAEALARGEFKSARAAAIAAGIITPLTPLEQILKLLPKLSDDERVELRRQLD